DTNMCIYAQKQNPCVLAKIKEQWQNGLAISSITLAELEYGVQKSINKEKNKISLLKFLSIVDVLPFDNAAALEYGKICAELSQKGQKIGVMDMLICAHAKSLGFTVVTHNTREFERVSELCLEDWYSE
ncbi:MAG: type II toxin-antitoxin system VapC family toxin, partial [Firmicutes bacterium]|nr:type II toxin-antitoxin system VapC family toxin [Bacillota bacterium]